MIEVRADDLSGAEIAALLRFHIEEAHRNSPPGHAFAFDIERLRSPDVSFWSAWDGDALLGCGALRELDGRHGEIKSMRTLPAQLRRGVAAALLDHMMSVARERGYRRLSLETGSGADFAAALALYASRGFAPGVAFGGYTGSDFNQFLHLDLQS